MAKGCISSNTYETARNQQVELNKKKFQDLGILETSKCLAALSNSEKKSKQHSPKPKSKTIFVYEPRRSTRARNPVPSYRDDVGIDLPPLRKRSRVSNSWGSYLTRPLEEVREASQEERDCAFEAALELQSELESGSPSFIKSMIYIVKAFPVSVQEQSEDIMNNEGISAAQTASKTGTKRDLQPNRTQTSRKAVISSKNDLAHLQKLQPESETNIEDIRDEKLLKKNGSGSQRNQKQGKSAGSSEFKKHEIVENTDRCATGRTRKKPAAKLLRKKVY